MTRNPAARRVHRADSAPDDRFVAGVLETSAWARTNARNLLIGGGIAAVVLIGAALYWTSRSGKIERASAQLTQARAIAQSGNAMLAVRELDAFLGNFSGTPAEAEARLLLGRAYLDMDSASRAISAVEPLTGDVATDIGVNANMLKAAAHEAAGQPQEAEQALLRVAEGGRFLYQKQEALDQAARIRMQGSNPAGAVELYERLLSITPETSTEWPVYQLRLGEAKAMAAAAAAGGAAPGAAPDDPAVTSGG